MYLPLEKGIKIDAFMGANFVWSKLCASLSWFLPTILLAYYQRTINGWIINHIELSANMRKIGKQNSVQYY